LITLYEADSPSCSAVRFNGPVFFFSVWFWSKTLPRLTGTITETSRATLAGSRSPRALSGQDMGAVSPEMIVPGITLVFKRSADQENALRELLTAQENPDSPLYHHWLTPDTFAARFGIADEDIAAIETWLQSRGIHIDSTSRTRDRITFSGNAAQVQAAFGSELHYYQTEGEMHFAPQSDLTLPTELASMTAAVLHLSNFRPKPNVKASTGAQPNYTTLSTQAHYLTPKDIITMYGLTGVISEHGFGRRAEPRGRRSIVCRHIEFFEDRGISREFHTS
jgi:subtilase family serine protease